MPLQNQVMMGFFECIEFYKIPATVLMREGNVMVIFDQGENCFCKF